MLKLKNEEVMKKFYNLCQDVYEIDKPLAEHLRDLCVDLDRRLLEDSFNESLTNTK